jgi:hypothetical protein
MGVTGTGSLKLDLRLDRVTEHPYVTVTPPLGSNPIKDLVRFIYYDIGISSQSSE